jgi:hypothetical protein
MHRFAAPVVLVSLLGPAAVAEDYTSREGKYEVKFPGKVKEQSQVAPTPVGKVKIFLAVCERSPDLAYLVSYVDYPAAAVKAPPQKVLAGVRDGNARPGGKVLSDKEIAFGRGKLPGRDVLIEKPGLLGRGLEGHFRNRMILRGARLYQVAVVGSKAAVTAKEADDFIASFRLTE